MRRALGSGITLLATLLGAIACGAPPSSSSPTVVTARPLATSAPTPDHGDASLVSTDARAIPTNLVVDGDLGEWGPLTPAPSSSTTPPPPRAASAIVVALGADRVAIAAELRGEARAGALLQIQLDVDDGPIPPVGVYSQLYAVEPDRCDPPTAACEARDAVAARKSARGKRVLVIDGNGFHDVGGGARKTIAGDVRVHDGPDARWIEASLPLSVLPNADAAPVHTVTLAARPGDRQIELDQVRSFKLVAPVAFEPDADLRAAVFRLPFWGRFAYAPGSPNVTRYSYTYDDPHIDDLMHANMQEVVDVTLPLRGTATRLGDVEVVPLLGGTAVAIVRGDAVLTVRKFLIDAVVPRDGELHVIGWWANAMLYDGDIIKFDRGYGVIAVSAAGVVREKIVEDSPAIEVTAVEAFHDPDYARFGFVQTARNASGHGDHKETVTWKYDEKKRAYVLATPQRPRTRRP